MATERQLTLDILMEVTYKNAFFSTTIRNVLEKYDYLEPRSKAFIRRLSAGTLERMIELDYILDCYSSTPVKKMKPVICTILRMSAYQILFMDSVPDSAACNEAVKLAQKRGFSGLKGFVNAVLRKITNAKGTIQYPDEERDTALFDSVTYSMPIWLTQLFLDQYQPLLTKKILKGLQKDRPVVIRIRETLSQDKTETLKKNLEKTGVRLTQYSFPPCAYQAESVQGISNLPGFEEGWFTVQDIGSMMVAILAGIHKDDNILDICAAPGGKTFHAVDSLGKNGCITARDLTEEKVELLKMNRDRLKPEAKVVIEQADACVFDANMVERYDIVFADLPCSGLGVIGRKPDIKYRVTREDLKSLTSLQQQILTNCAEYVKPGGILMYSTCTLNREENEGNTDWFLNHFPFETVSFEELLPESLKGRGGEHGQITMLPGVDDSEGFYIAKMRKS